MDLTDCRGPKEWGKVRLLLFGGVCLILIGLIVVIAIKCASQYRFSGRDPETGLPAIKVVVTNGCGIDRLAFDYAQSIDDLNVEVVALGNTKRPIYDKSIIVVRNGDMQDLKRLQDMTGIKRYTFAVDDNFQAEFEIIIGRDFDDYLKK